MMKLERTEMQKIILDTNVIVSSLIQKNYPYFIVDHCIEGNALIAFQILFYRNTSKFSKDQNSRILLTLKPTPIFWSQG